MENTTILTDQDANMVLKQKALQYLPRDLGEVTSQQQILMMIAQVAPAVSARVEAINKGIWQKVTNSELPINQAIAQCAYQADSIIGSSPVNILTLKASSETVLLQAWIALDYYTYVLKADYSAHLRMLQQQIGEILLAPEPGTAAVPVKDQDKKPEDNGKKEKGSSDAAAKTGKTKDTKPKKTKETKTGRTKNSKKLVLLLATVLIIGLVAVFLFSDTRQTEASIRKIGTVSLESEEAILKAEKRYAELSDSQQEKISNRDELFAARAEYDSLVTEKAINAIGTVTLESGDAITNAEKLYDELSRDAKNLVDNYKTLTAARKEYDRLDAAVTKAENAIDAIGTVTLQSGDEIEKARKAYDALEKDGLQKYLSAKVSTLTNAEKEFNQLYSQNLYDTGMAHHEKGEYEEAITAFDTIIADYSDTKVLSSAKQAKAGSQTALAGKAFQQRDYYTAMQVLEAVEEAYRSQENYQKIQTQVIDALTRNRPRSGAVVDGMSKWGYCYFQITAGEQDVCFKFENTEDPTQYTMVFVRAGESAKVNVADGEYSIKFVTGSYWYGKEHLFGEDAQYRSRGSTSFETTRDGSWIYYWYLELNLSDSGFKSNPLKPNEF